MCGVLFAAGGSIESFDLREKGYVRKQLRREDIRLIDDKGIQRLLKDLENSDVAIALKMATPELMDKFLGNVSTRAAEVIREDMEFMGPVRVSDVEAVQQRIVDMVRRLEDSGEIVISGRGGDGDIVV